MPAASVGRLAGAGVAALAVVVAGIVPATTAAQVRLRSISTFVRVDQAGYPTTAVKAAFVISSASQSGDAGVVSSSGSTVDTFPLGSSLGAWNPKYSHVYKVVFSSVTTTGTYTIAIGGVSSVSVMSAPYRLTHTE